MYQADSMYVVLRLIDDDKYNEDFLQTNPPNHVFYINLL